MSLSFTEGVAEQMRRAVKDYKYEVNEGHMTEECSQYLAQLQKDWERHRVKLGVEALRKEVVSSTTTNCNHGLIVRFRWKIVSETILPLS
jgi:hypothetical protein